MENQETIVSAGRASPGIRSVDVNRGVEWLVGGFRMFFKSPGLWLLVGLAFLLGSWILGKFWLGSALSTAFGIVFAGAVMRGCQALENGQDFVTAIKEPLSSAPLWILGLIGAALAFGTVLLVGLLGVGSFTIGAMSPGAVGGLIGIGLLVLFALTFVLYAALWLAPALVVLQGVNPVDAIRLSLMGTLRNILAYVVFSLLAILACILGALPIGLGLLIVFPALMCASYLAYKDMFATASVIDSVAHTPQ